MSRQRRSFSVSVVIVACAFIFVVDQVLSHSELQHQSGWPCAFARKHSFPVGKYELWDHLQRGDLEGKELEWTLTSLKTAYEEDIIRQGNRRKWELALAVFDEMQERDIDQDENTYFAALQACSVRVREWERCLHLLGDAKQDGLRLSAAMYNAAIHASRKAKRWNKAIELFREMLQLTVDPDHQTYKEQLHFVQGGGLWEYGLHLLDSMKEHQMLPDGQDYNRVLEASEAVADYEIFDEIVELMGANGYTIREDYL